ncbi:MAG: metallophosphoesterase [Betaproteobacteria bacterium]|nr:metallophosphoesterase [Betaproteobacteria bacterium]
MSLGEKLFSFAVIADTHVNQEEGKASSDFAVNRLANARNRYVIHALNRAKPAFTLHLGDIVHPTPRHPGFADAARSFHALAAALECPLHLTPGNHDVGDKPGDWLPVPSVSDEYLAIYERHFGKPYYAFDSHGCHFVVINAQALNSGLPCEAEQKAWLEGDLAAHAGQRTFLCTHYPAFLFDPAEPGHYDNIDEPGRSWLLGLFARHGVEGVFAGHVHNFWYHLLGETEFYLLPSTAFVRLDYSELYRVGPGPERGRNDAPKLGFLIVDVHEHGHVAHPVRTQGACLGPDEKPQDVETLPPVHSRSVSRSPLGIDLRHPWAEVVDVVASGALDEFSRKRARNDDPLMALWEMGIQRLRVPLADLDDARLRERMRVLKRAGARFTVYSHNVPAGSLRQSLLDHAHLVDAWEVIAPMAGIEALAAQVADLRRGLPFAVRHSKLRRPEDRLHHGDRARHVIEHGFYLAEREQVEALRSSPGAYRAAFDGGVFRVSRGQRPWHKIGKLAAASSAAGTRDEAYVRLAADNPAEAQDDDLANANRVAETLFTAHACVGIGVWLDTFCDVDRGYFPRTGLVDRRYNPRLAGKVCRNLNSALSGGLDRVKGMHEAESDSARTLILETADGVVALVLPRESGELRSITLHGAGTARSGRAKWIDLASGTITAASWRVGESEPPALNFEEPRPCTGPALVILKESGFLSPA